MVLRIKTEEERVNEDFLWLSKNTPLLQKKYGERWIAIINKKVVSSGDDAKRAYNEAKKKFPEKEPLLDFIPKRRLLVL